jgi:hypothetical protein
MKQGGRLGLLPLILGGRDLLHSRPFSASSAMAPAAACPALA